MAMPFPRPPMSWPRPLSPQELALMQQMGNQPKNQLGGLGNGGHRQAPTTLPGNPPQAGGIPNWGAARFPYPGAPYFPPAYAIPVPPTSGAITRSQLIAPIFDTAPIEDAGIRPGEVTAWRCWRLNPLGLLRSMAMDNIWAPDEAMEGDPKQAGCHAWKKLGKALEYAQDWLVPVVVGQVELWGEIVEHEHGYRAENAAIVSLDGILGGSQEQLNAVRKVYGVGGRDGLVVAPQPLPAVPNHDRCQSCGAVYPIGLPHQCAPASQAAAMALAMQNAHQPVVTVTTDPSAVVPIELSHDPFNSRLMGAALAFLVGAVVVVGLLSAWM